MTRKTDGRARAAKGSVQEAIGKLIGDVLVEQRGASESKAGARDCAAADTNSDPARAPEPGPAADDVGRKDGAN